MTTPDIRAHIKLPPGHSCSYQITRIRRCGRPWSAPRRTMLDEDGDLQGPEGAAEGETWATLNQSTPEGYEEALPGGSGWQQECCPVPGCGLTLHQDPCIHVWTVCLCVCVKHFIVHLVNGLSVVCLYVYVLLTCVWCFRVALPTMYVYIFMCFLYKISIF